MSEWDLEADAVVVGSGAAALSAALVARTRGLDVLLLEKTNLLGGSTAMSGGGMWVPASSYQLAAGVQDSAEDALTYFEAIVGDVGPASSIERRTAFVTTAPKVIDFFGSLGIPFTYAKGYSDYYPDAPGGKAAGRTLEAKPFAAAELGEWADKLRPGSSTSLGLVGYGAELSKMSYYNRSVAYSLIGAKVLARTYLGKARKRRLVSNGAALVGRLLQQALKSGAQIRIESPVTDLVVQDGVVTGVVATLDGVRKRIHARKGVLLAAGGYARNTEFRNAHGGSQLPARWTVTNPGDTGDALAWTTALGATTALLDEAIWLPSPAMPDGGFALYPSRSTMAFGRARWRPGSIIVDSSGARFANEAESHTALGKAMYARSAEGTPAVPSWLIFDDTFRRRCLFGVVPGRLPSKWINDGFVQKADTLDALAAKIGVDARGLGATVERFNGFAKTGVDDDFHRGESAYDKFLGDPQHKPNNCLAPIARGPFYATAIYPFDLGTCGGVIADEHARVLDGAGTPIAGLYAAGNVTASILGRVYPGAGGTIASAATFGYIAMQDIANR